MEKKSFNCSVHDVEREFAARNEINHNRIAIAMKNCAIFNWIKFVIMSWSCLEFNREVDDKEDVFKAMIPSLLSSWFLWCLKKGLQDMTHQLNSVPGACWEISWPIFIFRSFVMTRVNRRRGKNVFARLVMHKNNNKLCGSSHASLEVHFRVLISRTSIPFLPTAILFYFQKKTLHLNFYWAHGSHSSVTHKHNPPLIN